MTFSNSVQNNAKKTLDTDAMPHDLNNDRVKLPTNDHPTTMYKNQIWKG